MKTIYINKMNIKLTEKDEVLLNNLMKIKSTKWVHRLLDLSFPTFKRRLESKTFQRLEIEEIRRVYKSIK